MSEISVPGYEIRGVLGQGGFGIVYLALQSAVGREVALKVDNRVLLSDRDRRRFLREVTAAGALSGHPHVVPVYDAGLLPDGRPYMVLELCPGGSLSGQRLRPEAVRDVGVRIADALAAAHAQGVLHRDVKPANLLLNRYGHVALSDFGLATMPDSGPDASVTRESLTPAYAPPEAFELAEPSAAGDVYSLAATLYALLSGRPPRFPASGVPNLAMVLAMHRLPVPDIPGVPPALTAVLRQALVSDPHQRTPSAAAFRDALTALRLDSEPVRSGSGPVWSGSDPRSQGADPVRAGSPNSVPSSAPGAGRPADPYQMGYAASQPVGPPGPGQAEQFNSRPAGRRRRSGGGGRDVRREDTVEPVAPRGVSRVFLVIVSVCALVLATGAGVVIYEHFTRGPETGQTPQATGTAARKTPAAARSFGVETYTKGCPASAVPGANASCVRDSECWAGLVVSAGDTTARRLGCEETHSWETFAIAPLPADSLTYDQRDLSRHPLVKKACSTRVLLATRYGAAKNIADDKWISDVMPPSSAQFDQGVRVYRCVGALAGAERSGSVFRPSS
ncbi:serine/threonine-protein kinase [Nonomuraea sp. NEAU-A123]|uniref:serine/threonine-protein kinase n=1 Tax=Nonomuraea sp. NEAU-A123 TaxID=2839649 RepID=UPI001BE4D706|nr:serine/threonine-protein kinase [Nonomuraea sp. NEAU-A123]MBT2232588.1 serine/threonine protein kinase [Nonomuraea sp. NEAU-A123]